MADGHKQHHRHRSPARLRIALVGADTLVARELRDLIAVWDSSVALEMISASAENAAVLTRDDEEALPLIPLTKEALAGAQVVFLAGSPASSRKALKLRGDDGPRLVDLTAALEDQPNARLRAPSGENPSNLTPAGISVIAHPAAAALAQFLRAIATQASIAQCIVHVMEPASERGKTGVEELHQQTVATLSFKPLKKKIFDAQLSFNVLARYGEEAAEPLEGVEEKVGRHLASLLASESIVMPSLRLIQVPVFHGYSFSIWIRFNDAPDKKRLESALSAGGIDVRVEDPPSNAGTAGQEGLSAGAIAADANDPRAYWFWLVTDNLRLTAANAIEVAKEFLSQ